MATSTIPVDPQQAARFLLAIQVGDAVASATLPIIERDLVRLGCPRWMRRTIPVLKAASAVGLVAGRRQPRLGRLTTDALVAYFACALAAHGRVRDPAWRWAAATGMLGIVLVARQAYAEPEPEVIDLTEEPIDLTTPAAQETRAAGEPAQPATEPAEPADA